MSNASGGDGGGSSAQLPYGLPGGPGGFLGPDGGYEYLSDIVDEIVEAAIDAGMEHENYRSLGGGVYAPSFAFGMAPTVRWDGSRLEAGHVQGGFAGDQGEFDPNDTDGPLQNQWGQERVQAELDRLVSEVFGFYTQRVPEAFARWYGISDPSGFDSMRSQLAAGATYVSAVAGVAQAPTDAQGGYDPGAEGNVDLGQAMTNLITRTGQMGGRAAKTFAEDYVAPLPGVLGNDHLVTTTLGIALSAQQNVMGFTRDNVAGIANKAVTAMRNSGPEKSETDGLGVVLTVLGAVAGAVATVASGGTAAPIVAGLLATGAGAASGIIGSQSTVPRKEVELGAGHPRDVLANIENGLDELDTAVTSQETDIETLLTDVEHATHDPGQYDLSRPHLLAVRRVNLIVKDDEIFINHHDLNNITGTWMPQIAAALISCRKGLVADSAPFTRSGGIGLGAVGPWRSYDALQDRLTGILTETSFEIHRAAEHMAIAGRILDDADRGDVAGALDRDSDQLDRILDRRETRLGIQDALNHLPLPKIPAF